jgi:hypothetical protein
LVGRFQGFDSPLGGLKPIVYADWTASGRQLHFIEVRFFFSFSLFYFLFIAVKKKKRGGGRCGGKSYAHARTHIGKPNGATDVP